MSVFVEPGDVRATVVRERSRSFFDVTFPTPPQPFDGQRVQEPELVVDRDDEQAVGFATPLATFARNLAESLDPTR